MAIYRVGDKAQLVKAATGVEPTPRPSPSQTTMAQAMASKVMPTPSYGDFVQQAGLTTAPLSSTMGLSSEGKYGGFYTSSDLDRAIRGETMARNEELLDYASSLRELAAKQRSQVGQQVGQRIRQAQGAESFMGPVGPGTSPEAQSAQEYGTRRMAELDKGEMLAGQIEATPASQLARSIAERKYGVNPALASGMYGTEFDIETAKNLRDQYYYESGQGYGYQDYLSEMAREQSARDRETQDLNKFISEAVRSQDPQMLYDASQYSQEASDLYYNQLVSSDIGMDASKLFRAAQVTPQQGYELLQQRVSVGDSGATANFAEMADQAIAQIANDDVEGAFSQANQLIFSEDEGTRMLGRLLATYVDNLVRAAGKTGRGLYQYQQASDILAP